MPIERERFDAWWGSMGPVLKKLKMDGQIEDKQIEIATDLAWHAWDRRAELGIDLAGVNPTPETVIAINKEPPVPAPDQPGDTEPFEMSEENKPVVPPAEPEAKPRSAKPAVKGKK